MPHQYILTYIIQYISFACDLFFFHFTFHFQIRIVFGVQLAIVFFSSPSSTSSILLLLFFSSFEMFNWMYSVYIQILKWKLLENWTIVNNLWHLISFDCRSMREIRLSQRKGIIETQERSFALACFSVIVSVLHDNCWHENIFRNWT